MVFRDSKEISVDELVNYDWRYLTLEEKTYIFHLADSSRRAMDNISFGPCNFIVIFPHSWEEPACSFHILLVLVTECF